MKCIVDNCANEANNEEKLCVKHIPDGTIVTINNEKYKVIHTVKYDPNESITKIF